MRNFGSLLLQQWVKAKVQLDIISDLCDKVYRKVPDSVYGDLKTLVILEMMSPRDLRIFGIFCSLFTHFRKSQQGYKSQTWAEAVGGIDFVSTMHDLQILGGCHRTSRLNFYMRVYVFMCVCVYGLTECNKYTY